MREKTDLRRVLCDAQYKDETPMKTVERIREILREYDIETEVMWNDSGVVHCYSNQVSVKGTGFCTNGKGLTKDFALASAYGELMERMQLGMVCNNTAQKSGYYNEDVGSIVDIPIKLLLQRNSSWYEAISRKLYLQIGTKMSAREVLMQFADHEEKVKAISCYNLRTGEYEYYPQRLRDVVYGSNGAAAGNTLEEAVVQAISEIVERHHQHRILTEHIVAPDIPEEVLQEFSVAYGIINQLRNAGIRVYVKDCSLSTRFPVVCVCYIDEKSGRYRTHFGASPILEIALERALTESFQGRKLTEIAQYENFSDAESCGKNASIMYEEFTMGSAEKTLDFFVGLPAYAWKGTVGFAGKDNKQLLSELVDFFGKQGYDILVHNASYMGFPTCQVVIPGYSEVMINNIAQNQSMFRYLSHSVKTLRNPTNASREEYMGFLMHISKMSEVSEKDSRMLSFSMCSKLSLELDDNEESFFLSAALAFVYYELGNLKLVGTIIDQMIPLAKQADVGYLVCLKRYLHLILNKYSDRKTHETLSFFHNHETIDALITCIEDKKNPFDRFTLHCDQSDCGDCLLHNKCGQKKISKLTEILMEKAKRLNTTEFFGILRRYTFK